MIICSTEWPDINPRKLHLLSLVNPRTCDTLTLRTFWCGNITGFHCIFFCEDSNSLRKLHWRKPASEDEHEDEFLRFLNMLSDNLPSSFKFSLEEHGYLEIKLTQLLVGQICIKVLPEFNVLPESLCSTNTLGIPVIESSVMLTIDQCEDLIYL
jgi:hypothetical protein